MEAMPAAAHDPLVWAWTESRWRKALDAHMDVAITQARQQTARAQIDGALPGPMVRRTRVSLSLSLSLSVCVCIMHALEPASAC
jgi:hypothetical protein